MPSRNRERRPRDRKATESRLQEAGLRLFAQQGYAETSIESIGRLAGANKSLVVRYFGSKAGLLETIVGNLVEEKSQVALPYPPQQALEKEICEYLRFRFRTDALMAESIRFLFGRLLVDAEFKHKVEQMVSQPDSNFVDRIRLLSERGLISQEADATLLFRMVSTFSFAVNFTSHQLLGVPAPDCDGMFQLFSASLATQLGCTTE